jgi:hypothetical protein
MLETKINITTQKSGSGLSGITGEPGLELLGFGTVVVGGGVCVTAPFGFFCMVMLTDGLS